MTSLYLFGGLGLLVTALLIVAFRFARRDAVSRDDLGEAGSAEKARRKAEQAEARARRRNEELR